MNTQIAQKLVELEIKKECENADSEAEMTVLDQWSKIELAILIFAQFGRRGPDLGNVLPHVAQVQHRDQENVNLAKMELIV